jgi:DNA-binding MarR family transcriptional regulator
VVVSAEPSTRATRESLVDEIQALTKAVFMGGGPPPLQALHHDLTMAQFRALLVLAHEAPLAIGVLGEKLGIGLPAASRIVDRMVTDGLVERSDDPADRRRALVRLAPQGQAAIDRIHQGRQSFQGRVRRLLLKLPDEDLAALKRVYQTLAAIAREEPL